VRANDVAILEDNRLLRALWRMLLQLMACCCDLILVCYLSTILVIGGSICISTVLIIKEIRKGDKTK